jgi:ABC-2 type transport system permease protein
MNSFVGTTALLRLNLRRDRIMIPAWLLALVITMYSSVATTAKLYPDEQSRQQAATAIGRTPAVLALYGPATDLGTLGGLAVWKPVTIVAVLTALMSMLLVVRHTRADEEAGRLELLGAGVVGRYAALTAALIVAFGTNVALAVLTAVSLVGQPVPANGVIAMSLGLGGVGCVFAALAAVAAQLTESARTANAMTATALGVVFLFRAAGDASGESGPAWLSWLSPIGWTQKVHPFGDLNWWPLVLLPTLVVLGTATAYALTARRDLAAGFLPPRLGPAKAAPSLRSTLALAWRLQRGSLLGWAVAFAVLGGVLGSIASTIGEVLGNSNNGIAEYLQRLGGTQVMTDAYIATSMGIAAVVASAYAVQATLRLRAEENAQRVEPLLATQVGRIRWALSHYAFAVLGSAVLLAVAGVASGLAHGSRVGDLGGRFWPVLGAALVQLPAVWVVTSIALAAFGLIPRYATVAWGALVLFLLIGELGPTLKLNQWVQDLSPYIHVPKLPYADLTLAPLVALTAIAVALSVAGLLGLRRRDIG